MATVFTLSITCENEAFGDGHGGRCEEVARIMRELAAHLETTVAFGFEKDGRLRDTNGNRVGSYAFADTDDAADAIDLLHYAANEIEAAAQGAADERADELRQAASDARAIAYSLQAEG